MVDERKIDTIRGGKPFNALDIIIFALAAVMITVLLYAVYHKKGISVEIVTRQGVYAYTLSENREIEVDGHLTVVIEDKKVYVKEADCPDKVCVHSGAISRQNQIIACMPNGIIIRLTGLSDLVEVG